MFGYSLPGSLERGRGGQTTCDPKVRRVERLGRSRTGPKRGATDIAKALSIGSGIVEGSACQRRGLPVALRREDGVSSRSSSDTVVGLRFTIATNLGELPEYKPSH